MISQSSLQPAPICFTIPGLAAALGLLQEGMEARGDSPWSSAGMVGRRRRMSSRHWGFGRRVGTLTPLGRAGEGARCQLKAAPLETPNSDLGVMAASSSGLQLPSTSPSSRKSLVSALLSQEQQCWSSS